MDVFLLGQSEVSYLEEPLVDQNVGRLQVPVDYIEFSEVFEALADLPEHVEDGLFPFLVVFLITVEEVPEIPSSTVLRDDVEEAVILG